MSERGEQTSKRMSEWPSIYVLILGCFEPLWCVCVFFPRPGRVIKTFTEKVIAVLPSSFGDATAYCERKRTTVRLSVRRCIFLCVFQ